MCGGRRTQLSDHVVAQGAAGDGGGGSGDPDHAAVRHGCDGRLHHRPCPQARPAPKRRLVIRLLQEPCCALPARKVPSTRWPDASLNRISQMVLDVSTIVEHVPSTGVRSCGDQAGDSYHDVGWCPQLYLRCV